MSTFTEDINYLLEQNMTEKGFKLWKALEQKIPPVWERLASSTKKFHKKENNRVPTIAEHTYEMLFACVKIMSLFDFKSKTAETDGLLLAIALHDSLKYGMDPDRRKHTDHTHDKLIADVINKNREIFLKVLNENEFSVLEEATRYHTGRWSTDVGPHNFNWKDFNPETFFVHILDMLSSRNCLKI